MTSGDLFQTWKVLVQRLLKYHPYHPVRDGLTITPAGSGVQKPVIGGFPWISCRKLHHRHHVSLLPETLCTIESQDTGLHFKDIIIYI